MEIPLSGPAADRSGYAAHDACRDLPVNHRKALAPGRGREPLIEADNLERGRIVIGRDQGGRELKTIGRPRGVHAQQPLRRAAQGRRRHDLVPAVGEMARNRQRRLEIFRRQRILPFTSRDGRGNLDRRSPPGEYLRVLLEDSEHGLASGLLGKQRNDGGGVPELHGRTRLIAPPADRGAAPRGDGMRGPAACQGRPAASRPTSGESAAVSLLEREAAPAGVRHAPPTRSARGAPPARHGRRSPRHVRPAPCAGRRSDYPSVLKWWLFPSGHYSHDGSCSSTRRGGARPVCQTVTLTSTLAREQAHGHLLAPPWLTRERASVRSGPQDLKRGNSHEKVAINHQDLNGAYRRP